MSRAPAARNPGRAFVRGAYTTLDRQHSWHFAHVERVRVVTVGLAHLHARDVAQRAMRAAGRKAWNRDDQALHDAALNRMLALVGEPVEVLFQ